MGKRETTGFFSRLCMFLTCLLMIVAMAVTKNGRLLGNDLRYDGTHAVDSSGVRIADDGSIVISTQRMAADVQGYNGPVPLTVFISGGRIDSIRVGENDETPSFLERVEEGIIRRYEGMTVSEARNAEVDAVSGATFSSDAVLENIHRALSAPGLDRALSVAKDRAAGDTSRGLEMKHVLALVVCLMAAFLPLFVRSKRYRIVQLALNVLVVGLYAGMFVSYSSMVNVVSNGLSLHLAAVAVMLVMAFVYPLFGRHGHYCSWCCPLGSVQELAGHVRKRKLHLPHGVVTTLGWVQRVLWGILMLMAWSGTWFGWMDYELFAAFIWQSASWTLTAFAVVTIAISVFVPRPYCRFVCPTGLLLKSM
ncbi:MAG: FMN-binding protein [Prevotella sp.]